MRREAAILCRESPPPAPAGERPELNNVSRAAVDQRDSIHNARLIPPVHHREECLHRELHHRPERDYRRQLQAQEPDDEGLHHVGQRRNRIFPLREPDYCQLLGEIL